MQIETYHQTIDQLPKLEILLKRSTRDRRPSTWYHTYEYVLLTDEYVLLTNEGEPQCYAKAVEDENMAH